MVNKIFHIALDVLFIGAIATAGWLVAPALGILVAGVGGLVLHGAVTGGTYE